MKRILETGRLFLRQFSAQDAGYLYELNRDPEVIQFTGDPPFDSVENAAEFLEGYDAYRKDGFGRWAVVDKSTGEFIGWCGLKRNSENQVDIGFRFFKKVWNRGYATESARACLEYGFRRHGFQEIIGRAAKKNSASIRVLEKIGMVYWKEGPCEGIPDAVYYRITANEFTREGMESMDIEEGGIY